MAGASIIQEPTILPLKSVPEEAGASSTISCRIKPVKFDRGLAASTSLPEVGAPSIPAAQRQSAQLPAFAPLLEELEVAGWSSHRRTLSGNFHDWSLLENRTLLVMAGQAIAAQPNETIDPIDAALVAQGAWASIRSHAHHAGEAGTLLSLAARSLWSNIGLGIQMAVALIDLEGGHASVAMAGDCLALRVRATGCEQIASRQPVLGGESDFSYLSHSVQLSLRERILLIADEPQRPEKLVANLTATFARLDAESHRRMMAADMVAIVRGLYEQQPATPRSTASMVAVRRR